MKELVFALPFKGKAHPGEGVEGKLAAKTTAAGQVLCTALTAKRVHAKAESRPGPRAIFESEVQNPYTLRGLATVARLPRSAYPLAEL